MNLCISLPVATAPYYREARVTSERRQTAYRMRHCFARRIDGTGDKRKLVCTSTRWAERQRVVEAEANRIAMLTRLRRAQAFSFQRHKGYSSSRLPIKRLSFGRATPVFFLGKENGGRIRAAPQALLSLRAQRGISPLEFEQFHNCLFVRSHLRLHGPFVQMVVAQKVKHRVRHEVRELAAVRVAVFLRLRGDMLD